MTTIEICDEQLNAIVIKELSSQLSYLKEDYEDGRVGVFTFFLSSSQSKVKRLIKALERVLDWYEA